MNVGDLIKALGKLDPKTPVLVTHPAGNELVEVTEVSSWPMATSPSPVKPSSTQQGVFLW